jgi:ABC-type phosphate transport system substrate-binding protein
MTIKLIRKWLPLLCLGTWFCAAPAVAEVAIIAHPEFAAESATVEDIKRLFLGKASSIAGDEATPIDQKSGGAEWVQFYDLVVKKNASQLRAYWSRLVFTGKGKPPKVLDGDAEVVKAVAGDAMLIGYVDVNAVTSDVKILLTVP